VTLSLLDDSILAISVAISAGSVVVLFAFLMRYRKLTSDANKSSQLAKNIWDAMNSRLSVMDARIIDMMAKVEIAAAQSGSRSGAQAPPPEERRPQAPRPQPSSVDLRTPSQTSQISQPPHIPIPASEHAQEIERQVLRSLADGPKTSNEIKVVIDRSREHTARLMKILYGRGLVVRNDRNKPYVYEITDGGRRYLEGS
jgi:predicted transcriptional regulator